MKSYVKFAVVMFAALSLNSCKKETSKINEEVDLFYRLASVDLDQTVAYSKVIFARATVEKSLSLRTINSMRSTTDPGNSGGSGNDGDEGQSQQHFNGDGCNPNTAGFCAKHPWHKKCIVLLPIKLEYITVRSDGNKVTVLWKVSLEDNVDRYVIERSVDGIDFVEVGSVKPTGVNTNYSFTDLVK